MELFTSEKFQSQLNTAGVHILWSKSPSEHICITNCSVNSLSTVTYGRDVEETLIVETHHVEETLIGHNEGEKQIPVENIHMELLLLDSYWNWTPYCEINCENSNAT